MAKLKIEGKIEMVELASLHIDDSYQRGLKPHAKKIAAALDPDAVGTLLAARRADGLLYTIDGQQRAWALMKNGITKWRATVIRSAGQQHEAAVFRLVNGGASRKGLNAHELFRSCLTAGDPIAKAVLRSIEAAGLTLKQSKGGGKGWPTIACVGSLYTESLARGEEVVTRALKVLVRAWPGQDDCMRELLPISLIRLYGRAGDQIDDARMIDTLGRVPPRKIILDAMVGPDGRHSNAQHGICRIYNSRLGAKKQVKLNILEGTGAEAA